MTTTIAPPSIPTASPAQASQWLDGGDAVLIGVREPDEHASEHIAGSTLLLLSRFNPGAAQALSGKRLVLHCKGGKRSADAACMLLAAGPAFAGASGTCALGSVLSAMPWNRVPANPSACSIKR